LHYPLPDKSTFVRWDGENKGDWTHAFEGADAVVNLAGRSVNCRYNAENRKQILESRINTTRLVAEAIQATRNPPKVWLNSSGTSIYRDEFERDMDEETGVIGEGFLVEVGKAWEAAFFEADLPDTRRVVIRLSMVLGRTSPAFMVFAKLAKFFLAGAQGNGKQFVSWIHERDCLHAILFLLESNLSGPINLCAPNPLPNREFQKVIRESFGVKLGLPAPKIALKFGAIFLKTETDLILASRRAAPKRLIDNGFQFEFPTWKAACTDIVQNSTPTVTK